MQLQRVVALIAFPSSISRPCPLQAGYALAHTFRLFRAVPRQDLAEAAHEIHIFNSGDEPQPTLAATPGIPEHHALPTPTNPTTKYLAIPPNCLFLSPNPHPLPWSELLSSRAGIDTCTGGSVTPAPKIPEWREHLCLLFQRRAFPAFANAHGRGSNASKTEEEGENPSTLLALNIS